MTQPIIEINNLIKRFDSEEAVNIPQLEIFQGELFCLVGPDGAGKTTTIRLLCGLLKPDTGSISMFGTQLQTRLHVLKMRFGYLSQQFSLYGDLTIDENIEFFAALHHLKDFKTRRTELLNMMRLTPFRNRLADKLSGGMKQKLALACTLIHQPEIIFLDEPTTGVDPVSRREFWRLLWQLLQEGLTIVMSTPYMDEAERAHRVAFMHQSRLLIVDSPAAIRAGLNKEILEFTCDPIRQAWQVLKNSDFHDKIQVLGDRLHILSTTGSDDEPVIRDLLEQHQITILTERQVEPSLENVFISLLG